QLGEARLSGSSARLGSPSRRGLVLRRAPASRGTGLVAGWLPIGALPTNRNRRGRVLTIDIPSCEMPRRPLLIAGAAIPFAWQWLKTPTLAAAPRVVDLSTETVGAEPTSFAAIVGKWVIAADGDKRVLAVDGRKWKEGQASAGLADKARAIY